MPGEAPPEQTGGGESGSGKDDPVVQQGDSPGGRGEPEGPEERYAIGREVPETERVYPDDAYDKEGYLNKIAKKYGINLRGSQGPVEIKYDADMGAGTGRLGRTLEAEGGRVIRIGPDGAETEARAANTIAHELSHARDYQRGAGRNSPELHKLHGDTLSGGDGSAYGAGNALEEYILGLR